MERLKLIQHIKISTQLKKQNNELSQIFQQIVKTNSKNSKAVKRIMKLKKANSDLRCELDNILAKDYPEDFHPGVYYGNPDQG